MSRAGHRRVRTPLKHDDALWCPRCLVGRMTSVRQSWEYNSRLSVWKAVKTTLSCCFSLLHVENQQQNSFPNHGGKPFRLDPVWTTNMSNLRSIMVAVAPTIVCCTVGMAWLTSYNVTAHFVRTIGASHCQFTVGAGRLIFIHNSQWWRVEHFAWGLDRTTGDSPVDWPGFFEDTYWHGLGFEYASGEYLTSFTCVAKDTEFIPPFKPIEPGTILRVTRKFKIFVVPLWFPMFLTAILPATRIWVGISQSSRRRYRETPVSAAGRSSLSG